GPRAPTDDGTGRTGGGGTGLLGLAAGGGHGRPLRSTAGVDEPMTGTARTLRIVFETGWDPGAGPAHRGLVATGPRVRTLLKVFVSYPEVRFALPDRISLDAAASAPLLESIARFLSRQTWLVRRVDIA